MAAVSGCFAHGSLRHVALPADHPSLQAPRSQRLSGTSRQQSVSLSPVRGSCSVADWPFCVAQSMANTSSPSKVRPVSFRVTKKEELTRSRPSPLPHDPRPSSFAFPLIALGDSENPHPLQERMWKLSGSQCGFCTPGIVMSVYALLREAAYRGALTVEEVELEGVLDGNLCRCTGYAPILAAVKSFVGSYLSNLKRESLSPFASSSFRARRTSLDPD